MSVIKFTALSPDKAEMASCYLLQVNEVKILLDCGWDENLNRELVENVRPHIPHVDAVFLSHPDLYHLGALPYFVGKMGLSCPIYATIPVSTLGQLFMYDIHLSREDVEDFDLFSMDDIDTAFDSVKQLAYDESVSVHGGSGTTLRVTALPAGHMVGGTVWKIIQGNREVIVYGVDYNHRKERHLDGCSFEGIFRPHLFITETFGTDDRARIKRVSKDEQLSSIVSKTLKSGGNVLLSVDTAGRVLEVAYILEQMWENQDSGLKAYKLVLLNRVAYSILQCASLVKSEWMGEKIRKAMETHLTNDFHFKHLQVCHNMEELARISGPKVVLASMPDMESGYSRELFVQWCGNPNNSVIITSRTSPGTLSRTLVDNPNQKSVTLKMKTKVQLDAAEIKEYRKKQLQRKVEHIKTELICPEDGDNSSSDCEDNSEDSRNLFRFGYDFTMKRSLKRKALNYPKLSKRPCPMFPMKKNQYKQSDLGADYDPKLFSKVNATNNEYPDKQVEKTNNPVEKDEDEKQPTKCVTVARTLNVSASVTFIDFDGKSDIDFLKSVISQTKPLQIILVKGSSSSSEESISEFARFSKVLVSKSNKVLDATVQCQELLMEASDSLLSSLQWKKVKNYEVSWVDAMIDDKGGMPRLDLLPPEMVDSKDGMFVNNLRLSAFKEYLMRRGLKVEFSSDGLVINGRTKLKRSEAGCLVPEGSSLSEAFQLMEDIGKFFVTLWWTWSGQMMVLFTFWTLKLKIQTNFIFSGTSRSHISNFNKRYLNRFFSFTILQCCFADLTISCFKHLSQHFRSMKFLRTLWPLLGVDVISHEVQ